jgi:hypothetical protein
MSDIFISYKRERTSNSEKPCKCARKRRLECLVGPEAAG